MVRFYPHMQTRNPSFILEPELESTLLAPWSFLCSYLQGQSEDDYMTTDDI